MESLQIAFGKRLRDIRRRMDMTQDNLAERSDMSIQYISDIERGKRNLSLASIETLAKALNMSVSDLFALEDFQIGVNEMRAMLIARIEESDEDSLRTFYAISRAIYG